MACHRAWPSTKPLYGGKFVISRSIARADPTTTTHSFRRDGWRETPAQIAQMSRVAVVIIETTTRFNPIKIETPDEKVIQLFKENHIDKANPCIRTKKHEHFVVLFLFFLKNRG